MYGLFPIIALVSLVCIPLVFIKPKLFQFLLRRHTTRLKGLLFFIVCLILFSILSRITAPNIKDNSTKTPDISASTPMPTPTTDPNARCADMIFDHDAQQLCYQEVRTEQRMKNAGKDLKATVTSDTSGIYFTNTENENYIGCTAYIGNDPTDENAFSSNFGEISIRGTVRVGWETFAKSSGERFNYFTTKPSSITLECNDNANKNGFRDQHFIL